LRGLGDAVNVAARVEAATRESGDSLLLTRATRDALLRSALVASRGTIALKGKSEPVELFAPLRDEEPLSAQAEPRAQRDRPVRPLR